MASTFPADTPSYDSFSTPITLAALQHTVRHRQMEEDIVAIATKVGENSSAVTSSHDYKINALEGDVTTLQSDKADSTDVTSEIAAAIAAAKSALYPVGSIYIAVVSTNPATLLGFGTWSAFATGKTLVGIDTGQTEFDTVEETGGAKTHTLTIDEMPSHTHQTWIAGGGSTAHDTAGYAYDANARPYVYTTPSGNDQPHNNLQPYITVYMWKRTA
jgi:poly-gamma-glutamate capsule biosynthesis protein CapA/YwtB (metallophosphatase superfamily)